MAYRKQRSSFFTGWFHYLLGELRSVLVMMAVIALSMFLVASLLVGMYHLIQSLIWALLFN